MQKIKDLLTAFIDLLFPQSCLFCGQPAEASLCGECKKNIIPPPYNRCLICGKPMQERAICFDCSKTSCPYDLLIFAGKYEGLLMKAVHLFKYHRKLSLVEPLSELMIRQLEKEMEEINFSWVIPVPLHPEKKIQRGFNQAEELARSISSRFRIRLGLHLIKKIKFTPSQSSLSRFERKEAIKGAFALEVPKKIFKNERILLVDDVFTTGSTIREIAKLLKGKGVVKEIVVLTLARS